MDTPPAKAAAIGSINAKEEPKNTGLFLVDGVSAAEPLVALVCGLVTLTVTMLCSSYGKRTAKLIPFILGILAGYGTALVIICHRNGCNIGGI